MCSAISARRLDQALDIEAAGACGLERRRVVARVEVPRSCQDPEVVPVRESDDCPRVVVGESENPVVAPDGRQERQQGGRKPDFQFADVRVSTTRATPLASLRVPSAALHRFTTSMRPSDRFE